MPSFEYTCTLNSCKNGGSCLEGKCVCPEGYFGENCEGKFGLYIDMGVNIWKKIQGDVLINDNNNDNLIKIKYFIKFLISE